MKARLLVAGVPRMAGVTVSVCHTNSQTRNPVRNKSHYQQQVACLFCYAYSMNNESFRKSLSLFFFLINLCRVRHSTTCIKQSEDTLNTALVVASSWISCIGSVNRADNWVIVRNKCSVQQSFCVILRLLQHVVIKSISIMVSLGWSYGLTT